VFETIVNTRYFWKDFKIISYGRGRQFGNFCGIVYGEGREQQPLALITDAPVMFTEKINKNELYIDPRERFIPTSF